MAKVYPKCNDCGVPESQWIDGKCVACGRRRYCDMREKDTIEQRVYDWFVRRGVVSNGGMKAVKATVLKYIQRFIDTMDEQQKGKTMRNRSDFTITTEKTVRNGTMCRILYKGQRVYAFGTCPDTYQVQRRGRDNALLENAEVTIRQLMAGLVPSANVLMDALDA